MREIWLYLYDKQCQSELVNLAEDILPFVVVYHITTEYNVDASIALVELVNCDGLLVANTASDEENHFSWALFGGRWIDVREGHIAQCTSLQIGQHTLDQGLVLRVNVRHAH